MGMEHSCHVYEGLIFPEISFLVQMESTSIYYLLYLSTALHSPCSPDSVPPSIVHPSAVPLQLRRAAPQVVGKLNRAVIKTFPLTSRHVSDVGMESTLLGEGTESKLIFIHR